MALVASYSETNQDDKSSGLSPGAWGIEGVGQSFQTGSLGTANKLSSAKFYLRKFNSPAGNMYLKVYTHSGVYGTSSVPTGAALATSDSINANTLTTSYQLIEFTFSGANQITLSDSTNYVLTIEADDLGGEPNYVAIGIDLSSPGHSGNECELNAGSWIGYSTADACFYVYATEAAAGPTNLKTLNGLAKASVKTINGLAIASVKTYNGLT